MVLCHGTSLMSMVFANPQGGTVIGGQAAIDQSVSGLTRIQQGSNRAIINWNSFSNTLGERILFQQPGANAAALNRVTGIDPSVLNGSLDANGRVFLINPNGLLFGPTSQINVNGLTASTLDMDNDAFMSGSTATLRQNPNYDLGAVINQGQIFAGEGGVTLVAPLVNIVRSPLVHLESEGCSFGPSSLFGW